MQAQPSLTNANLYVTDTLADEHSYRARFYVDPNGLTLSATANINLLIGYNGTTQMFAVQMQKTSTSYQIRVAGRLSTGSTTYTAWQNIQDDWTAIEVNYDTTGSTSSLTLIVDGVYLPALTGSSTTGLESVRFGVVGADGGTSGTIYFDDFVSRRYTVIGLMPEETSGTQAEWQTRTFAYATNAPHAVASLTKNQETLGSYEYDAM